MAFQQLIGDPTSFFKAFCQLSGIYTSFTEEKKREEDGPDDQGGGTGASASGAVATA